MNKNQDEFIVIDRKFHSEQTKQGLALAKAHGKRLGRPPTLSEMDHREIIGLLSAGYTQEKVALKFGVSRMTICKVKNKGKAKIKQKQKVRQDKEEKDKITVFLCDSSDISAIIDASLF